MYSEQMLQLYHTFGLAKSASTHNLKEFNHSDLCYPFKCGLTTLFWYVMKVSGILGVREINIVLSFLHSPHFKLEDTPQTYRDLWSFEPCLNESK
jgi:hypothetical protein